MNLAMKLLFDECCSRRLARELAAFYAKDYPDLEIRHLLEDWPPGTSDTEWLSMLKDDPGWIVITKDAGRNSCPEKLPLICREWGITHVVFTSSIIQKGFVTQKNALVAIWGQLFHLHKLPVGTQVKLGEGGARSELPTFDMRIGGRSLNSVLKGMEG